MDATIMEDSLMDYSEVAETIVQYYSLSLYSYYCSQIVEMDAEDVAKISG